MGVQGMNVLSCIVIRKRGKKNMAITRTDNTENGGVTKLCQFNN